MRPNSRVVSTQWLTVLMLSATLGALGGCPKSSTAVTATALTVTPDAGPARSPEDQALFNRVTDISTRYRAHLQKVNDALWAHWLTGAPFDLQTLRAPAATLFTRETLQTLRTARSRGVDDDRALLNLEHALTAEAFSQALAEDNALIAGLEASATITVGDKEQPWRELNRQLATEKSAVKRKALWAASLKTAERLNAALARREAHAETVAHDLGLPGFREWAAEARELDLAELATLAERTLEVTDEAWLQILQQRSALDVHLPIDALTRADLPRLMRVPQAIDTEFSKAEQGARVQKTLEAFGATGAPGLTVDVQDLEKKKPLPLTLVQGSPAEVRVSIRPLAGLREQTLALSEVGSALALRGSRAARFETSVLGEQTQALLASQLFGGLTSESAWLEASGIAAEKRSAIVAEAQAQALFALRQAAATVLVRAAVDGLSDTEIPIQAAAVMAHALSVKHTPADGVRWRIDADEVMRAAAVLRASLQAAVVRQQLRDSVGTTWWSSPVARKQLEQAWRDGTAAPLESKNLAHGVELLAAQFKVAPTPVVDAGGPAVDAGTPTPEHP